MITKKMMMQKTHLLLAMVWLAMLLCSISFASSLGISPADKTIDFHSNTTTEMDFRIINSENAEIELGLSASGDLKDYIFFDNQIIKLSPDQESVPFKIILRFPAELEPGLRSSLIVISPIVPKESSQMFAAFISPQIPINVRVPYPAKYADVKLFVLEVDEGTPLPVWVEFDNMGSEKINLAYAKVDIYSLDNIKEVGLVAPQISVEKNTLGKTKAEPAPILPKGAYYALVKAYYDDISKSFQSNFSIGKPNVRISRMMTRELGLNQINKIVFTATNDWNTELSIQGMLSLGTRQEEMPIFRLAKQEEKEVTGFFDTTGLVPGEYNLTITLAYASQVTTETFLVRILEKPIEQAGIPGPGNLPIWLVVLIILLLVLVIAVLAFLIFKRRSQLKERNL